LRQRAMALYERLKELRSERERLVLVVQFLDEFINSRGVLVSRKDIRLAFHQAQLRFVKTDPNVEIGAMAIDPVIKSPVDVLDDIDHRPLVWRQ
jgi:hypothetical protein